MSTPYIEESEQWEQRQQSKQSKQLVDYELVIADLEAKKAHIESTIAALRVISGMAGHPLSKTLGPPPEAGLQSGQNRLGKDYHV
jgi:hypothetical protein